MEYTVLNMILGPTDKLQRLKRDKLKNTGIRKTTPGKSRDVGVELT